MRDLSFLSSSRIQLSNISRITYNKNIREPALYRWNKDLQSKNPIWNILDAKVFSLSEGGQSAHVIAMIDSRLPKIGIVGYFGCTNYESGVKVLNQATEWLKNERNLKVIYGPINGTITNDYRFNLQEDFLIPGEPINPTWYINVFKEAGFKVYNRYVSGKLNNYQRYIRLFIKNPSKNNMNYKVQSFSKRRPLENLKIYHEIMNEIFPVNSIYCPKISFKERSYNLKGKDNIFNNNYCFFLEDNNKPIGFIISYPYKNQLIVKTIAVLPEFRGKKLSSLLIKKVHEQAELDGLGGAIYSTIRVGNLIYKMKRPGVKIYRNYITMKKMS